MKILITGGTGLVGHSLIELLLSKNHTIIALTRSPLNIVHDQLITIHKDLSQLSCEDLPQDVDILITAAQSREYKNFPEQSESLFAVNVQANFRLWDWARSSKITKIIHFSSGSVYADKPAGTVISESDPLAVTNPNNFYAASKICSEAIFSRYAPFFASSICLRPFFVFGPSPDQNRFLATIAHRLRQQQPISLHGEDGFSFNPIFCDDVARIIESLCETAGHHCLNLAGDHSLTLRSMCDLIAKQLNTTAKYEPVDGPIPNFVASTAKLNQLVSVAMTPLSTALQRTFS